jgi:hypothetical protein
MKPPKLALLTIPLGCTLTFAKAASDTSQPGQAGSNQSAAENPAIGDDSRQYEDAYNKGDAKHSQGSTPRMSTTLTRTAPRLKDGTRWKRFSPTISRKIQA